MTVIGARRVHHMLFMIIERFEDDDMLPIYKRVPLKGSNTSTVGSNRISAAAFN
jgi:hypothetical protein